LQEMGEIILLLLQLGLIREAISCRHQVSLISELATVLTHSPYQ